MSDPDLSDEPSTDGKPATEAPVVAGAGLTFDALDSSTPLSAAGGPTEPGGQGGAADAGEDADSSPAGGDSG